MARIRTRATGPLATARSADVENGKIKLFNKVFASATGESFGRFRDDVLFDDPTVAIGTSMTGDLLAFR